MNTTKHKKPSRQLSLGLSKTRRFSQGRQDFIQGACYYEAFTLIDQWPHLWNHSVMAIVGAKSSGKSSIGEFWQDKAKAIPLSFTNLSGWQKTNIHNVWIDETEPLKALTSEQEQQIFAIFNTIVAEKGSLLLTVSVPCSQWSYSLPDLASRMKAVPYVRIGQPEDPFLSRLALSLTKERQHRLTKPKADLIAQLSLGNFDRLHRLVDSLISDSTGGDPFSQERIRHHANRLG